jgi:hypothetical protein
MEKQFSNKIYKKEQNVILNDEITAEKITEILSQYENGIKSIFESEKNHEIGNYLMILFNCPDSFHQKYSKINDRNSNSFYHPNILKLFNEEKKKQKNTESKNELEMSLLNSISIKENLEINIDEEENDYINMIKKIFEKFFGTYENILEGLIKKYLVQKNSENNNEFNYEDFIVIFCSIIKYYSGLNISLELNDLENYLFIFIYGDNKSYHKICKLFNYQLQISPIAINYEKNHLKVRQNYNANGNNDSFKDLEIIDYNEEEPLLQSFIKEKNRNNLQFEDYDINNPIFWPPYYSYKPEKEDKFREYESNDDYYSENNKINNNNGRSIFRNIDKLRFIQKILNQIIKFSELKKLNIFEMMIFKRNNASYIEKLKDLELRKIYNPFNYKQCNKTINTIRNYYGESVSYYFLWLDYYTRCLIFPSILGSFIFISYFFWNKIPLISIFSNSVQMDYYDFLLLLNCTLLTLWLTLFIKTWIQKEKIYNYIWGINESQKETKMNEEFLPNSRQRLIFGYSVPIEKEPFHTFKKFVSYIVLLGMILLVISFIYILFRLKARLVNGDVWHDYKISFYIACLNGGQIKIMNYIYYYIAEYLNNWENHFTVTSKNNSFAMKLILFDFVNSYSSLFYIAFVKPYNEGCINNNCSKELETQMYSIFLVYICVFFGELIYLYMLYYYQREKVGTLIKEEKIEVQGLEHQMMISPLDTLNVEYNDIINQFGFACLFSIAAPLTPLIIFLLSLVCRLVNYYKFVNLRRIEILDQSKGISFYKTIIKVFLFIGVMVNVSIFLFSNYNPLSPLNTIETIKNKFLTIFLVENTLLLIYFFVDWNVLPKWFKYKDIIKDLYLNKYFYKDEEKNQKNI